MYSIETKPTRNV